MALGSSRKRSAMSTNEGPIGDDFERGKKMKRSASSGSSNLEGLKFCSGDDDETNDNDSKKPPKMLNSSTAKEEEEKESKFIEVGDESKIVNSAKEQSMLNPSTTLPIQTTCEEETGKESSWEGNKAPPMNSESQPNAKIADLKLAAQAIPSSSEATLTSNNKIDQPLSLHSDTEAQVDTTASIGVASNLKTQKRLDDDTPMKILESELLHVDSFSLIETPTNSDDGAPSKDQIETLRTEIESADLVVSQAESFDPVKEWKNMKGPAHQGEQPELVPVETFDPVEEWIKNLAQEAIQHNIEGASETSDLATQTKQQGSENELTATNENGKSKPDRRSLQAICRMAFERNVFWTLSFLFMFAVVLGAYFLHPQRLDFDTPYFLLYTILTGLFLFAANLGPLNESKSGDGSETQSRGRNEVERKIFAVLTSVFLLTVLVLSPFLDSGAEPTPQPAFVIVNNVKTPRVKPSLSAGLKLLKKKPLETSSEPHSTEAEIEKKESLPDEEDVPKVTLVSLSMPKIVRATESKVKESGNRRKPKRNNPLLSLFKRRQKTS